MMMEELKKVCDEMEQRYGDGYLLRQLAEECTELAQAALKLIRAQRRETPISNAAARSKLIEELADVVIQCDAVYLTLLDVSERRRYYLVKDEKEARMRTRLEGGGMDARR